VNRSIPIYAGFMTKKIIRAFSKSAKYTIDNNFEGLNWKIFRTGDILDIKGLKIVPCHIDHSIPAAYGFIIYSSAGPIVYTGDFRMHGPLSNMTEEFLQEILTHNQYLSLDTINSEKKKLLSKGIKVLICEGTKVHKGVVESEKEVENNLEKIFENNPFDFILVKYDRLDWDRFRTFSNIAKKYGWKYIISEKDAYFYYLLNKDKIYKTMTDPNILEDDHIYILKKGNVKFKWQEKVRQALYIYQKSYRIMEYSDLNSLEGKFFVYLTDLRDDLMEYLNLNLRGLFISSSIDPFAEEFFDNTKTIQKELEKYGIPSYRIHASGHVMPHDLINFVEKVKPRYLIPIHTENARFFEKLFKNSAIQVLISEIGESIRFSYES
jgi:ribonuclease J